MKNEILEKVIETDEYPIPRYDIYNSSGSKVYDKVEIRLANTIQQAGTPLDMEHLFSDETRNLYGMDEDASVDDALKYVHTNKANAPVIAENVQVSQESWTQTDTYEDYPFSATATVTGMTADMIPEVVFALTDATSGTFAPVAAPTVDGVTIYASEQPQNVVTIPTIVGWSKNA